MFDLAAAVIDPDGEGGDPPAGIEITWTERCIGDYDQNGLVNASDLTPLGVHWQEVVAYDAPSLHAGCEYWPTGDPDDAGADNWRCARVTATTTGRSRLPTSRRSRMHFKERLSGYRVYRRGPLNADWVLLPDPLGGSSRAQHRAPAGTGHAPVRYSFTDSPGYPGLYDYYVIGYALGSTGVSAMEGEEASNIAQATLILEGVDVYPPVWQGAAGIGSATANEDGTVTVEWGTAIDEEHPPAPASPPVTLQPVLQRGDSPGLRRRGQDGGSYLALGFTAAGLRPGVLLRRTRPGQRPVPNEDLNSKELIVVVTGGVVDDEPPVWTGQTVNEQTGAVKELRGIGALKVDDGKVVIYCAPAEDLLSPPVHYDLYYLSLSGLEPNTRPLTYDGIAQEYILHENTKVIEDIAPVYELPWENRHPLTVAVVARDSAEPGNETEPVHCPINAPFDVRAIEIGADFPWALYEQFGSFSTSSLLDRERKTLISLVVPEVTQSQPIWRVYLFKQKILEGTWEAQMVYEHPLPEYTDIMDCALNEEDVIFAQIRFVRSLGDVYDEYWKMDLSGNFTQWDPGQTMPDWHASQLGHNGLPATTVLKESAVDPGYYSAYYVWYDEEAGHWKEEFVCDPGCNMYFVTRPDGVMQVCVGTYLVKPDYELPRYGKLYERDPEGNWQEVYCTGEDQTISFQPVPFWTFSYRSGPSPLQWGIGDDWIAVVRGNDANKTYVSYTYGNGYRDYTVQEPKDGFTAFPSDDAATHWFSYWRVSLEISGAYHEYYLRPSNYYMYKERYTDTLEFLPFYYVDPRTGEFAQWFSQFDVASGEYGYYFRSSYYGGASIFDPLAPGWDFMD